MKQWAGFLVGLLLLAVPASAQFTAQKCTVNGTAVSGLTSLSVDNLTLNWTLMSSSTALALTALAGPVDVTATGDGNGISFNTGSNGYITLDPGAGGEVTIGGGSTDFAGYFGTLYAGSNLTSKFGLPVRTPASAAADCTPPDIVSDTSFIYVCVGTNQWKRAAIATW